MENVNTIGTIQDVESNEENAITLYFTVDALMSAGFSPFMQKTKNRIYTTTSAYGKIADFAKSQGDNRTEQAQSSFKEINKYLSESRIIIKGSKVYKVHPAQDFLQLVMHKRRTHSVGIVTCSSKLAHDISILNKLKSCEGHYTYCYHITNTGNLYDADIEHRLQTNGTVFFSLPLAAADRRM